MAANCVPPIAEEHLKNYVHNVRYINQLKNSITTVHVKMVYMPHVNYVKKQNVK